MSIRGPRLEFAVGAFLLLALASLLVLALASTNKRFGVGGGSYELTARFSNLGQLRKQAPVKIGGVAARRGSTPFKVNFKAVVKGGSGKIKSITWDFGDGESASAKDTEHTFTQGLYVVILRVEDENGEKASAQTGISVEADCGC